MKPNPIRRCKECGKHIVRMKRVKHRRGYTLTWSQATYCSNACRQAAYRDRKKLRELYQIFGRNDQL